MIKSVQDISACVEKLEEDGIFNKIAWRILPILMLGYLATTIDRVNVSFAKLHMAPALGLSDAMYGFGAGIFFLGYFMFEVPSNLFLHKIGARKWLTRIMISWGVVSGCTMFVSSPLQFYVARFLLGVAEAGFIPGVIYYLTQWFPAHRRGRIMGIFYIALAMGGVIAGPVSGLILQTMQNVGNLQAWQWLFLLEAIPTIIIAIVLYRTIKDKISDVDWLTEEEKNLVIALVNKESEQKAHISLRNLSVNRYLVTMCLIFFANIFAIYGLGFWIPTLIKNMGVTNVFNVGLLAALPSLCAIPAMVFFGRSSDKTGERRWHLATLFLCGAAGLALTIVGQHNVGIGVFALCVASFGIIAIPAMFWALPTAVLGKTAAPVGIAAINCLANLAGFCGPYIVGLVKQATGSSQDSIWVMSAVLVIGAALVLSIPAKIVNQK